MVKSDAAVTSRPAEEQSQTKEESGSTALPPPRIFTRGFVLLCLVGGLAYLHNGFLGPILPLYISSLGYSEIVVGLVMAAFAFSSFLIRPFLGYLADTWSVRGVQTLGVTLLGLAATGFLIPLLPVIALLNAARGIGWAAFNTGGNTLLAYAAPGARRAEAASYLALFHSVPSTFAAPVALWVLGASQSGFGFIFLIAAGAAFAGAGLSLQIPAPASQQPQGNVATGSAEAPATGIARFLDRGVLLPTSLLVCYMTVHPAVHAFVPLFALQLGITLESLSWYYIVTGATAILGRMVLGRLADRLGRRVSFVIGLTLVMLGLLLHSFAIELVSLTVAGIVFTLGSLLHTPSTMALAIDRADPRRRGRSMASYSLGTQVGMGIGAPLAGVVVQLSGYSAMYAVMLLPPFLGLMIVAFNWRSLRGGTAHAGH